MMITEVVETFAIYHLYVTLRF